MRGLILASLWVATTLSGEEPTSADPLVAADDTAEAIETYIPPKLRRAEIEPLKYPRRQAARWQEGWVLMNFMVDPKGKPYEIEVMDSVGDDYFRKAALRAVETWRFEPPPCFDGSRGLTFNQRVAGSSPAGGAIFP